ncbi:alpha ketoglutarate dependent [Trichuris trichiura]|uniref:Alpha ketoglutarate dependent n=1 Tax=Trichuris trichiura TaxID=36087 RepID=A0A077YWG1_TRITR|nr:alpha ketoglutarate dependent [Trichuris trichiura]
MPFHYPNTTFWTADEQEIISEDFILENDFVTAEEEKALCEEAERALKMYRYEREHWDDAITNYREIEKTCWEAKNKAIINRVRRFAFANESDDQRSVHVLDLAKDGVVKPHVDSTRYCGDIIAGLNLMSDVVLRLRRCHRPEQAVDVLVKRRDLYVMKGAARHKYTHETLADSESVFAGKPVPRSRRIAIICRSHPNDRFIQIPYIRPP